MKLRETIIVGLMALAVICAFVLPRSSNRERKAAEETRRLLRQQGFKTDLTEFNFSTSAEMRNRAAALIFEGQFRPGSSRREELDLMASVGSNSALVVWKLDKFETNSGKDGWAALRQSLDDNREALDTACQAALSGPIRFDLDAKKGTGMLLRHLAPLRKLSQTLGSRTVLELHDQHQDAAWTNLLAATRLVTAWAPESCDISHLVHHVCATIVFNITWQALQADHWPDDRLARLQREWESVDFLKNLPETAAFSRASMVSVCQQERLQPRNPGIPLNELFRNPRYAWNALLDYWQQMNYRSHGTYEDEKALLLYYQNRELQLRQAVQSPTWLEMSSLPGASNAVPFQSKYRSRLQVMLNMKQLSLALQFHGPGSRGRNSPGQSLLGRAVETEARRQLILTAIALERFRGRHGSYPKTLPELSPEFLPQPLVDFMDGKPLRYQLTDDKCFVLYSIGLDGVDDGGQLPQRAKSEVPYPALSNMDEERRSSVVTSPLGKRVVPYGGMGGFGNMQNTDLIWPRPATEIEIQAQEKHEIMAAEASSIAHEQEREAARKRSEVARQANVAKLLAEASARKNARATAGGKTNEPSYKGQPLSKMLQPQIVSGKTPLTLDELLTLKQIITGAEPDTATFEVPIRYNVMTNIGTVRLLVDGSSDETHFHEEGQMQSFERATNGNCLLVWDTTYDPPGQHAIQAQFFLPHREEDQVADIKGPITPFYSSNLCQFDSQYGEFNPQSAVLYARLVEPRGSYTIEVTTSAGQHLRTFTGTTTNGTIHVLWDVTDD